VASKIIRTDVGFRLDDPAGETASIVLEPHEPLAQQPSRHLERIAFEESAGEAA
jgi:hypothetical protein